MDFLRGIYYLYFCKDERRKIAKEMIKMNDQDFKECVKILENKISLDNIDNGTEQIKRSEENKNV